MAANSLWSQSICNMVGTAENDAMPRLSMIDKTVPASNFGKTTTVPPLNRVGRLTCPRPVA